MNDYSCSISTKKGTTTLQKLFHGKKAHEAGSYNNNYHQNTYYNYLVIERPSRKTKSQFKRNILNFIHFLASSFWRKIKRQCYITNSSHDVGNLAVNSPINRSSNRKWHRNSWEVSWVWPLNFRNCKGQYAMIYVKYFFEFIRDVVS